MRTFWISFANEEHGSFGVVITDAVDEPSAVQKVKNLGLYPGGEARLYDMTECPEEVAQWQKDRLIAPRELRDAGYISTKNIPDEINQVLDADSRVVTICEDCIHDQPGNQ
jgi:hypothetical protein